MNQFRRILAFLLTAAMVLSMVGCVGAPSIQENNPQEEQMMGGISPKPSDPPTTVTEPVAPPTDPVVPPTDPVAPPTDPVAPPTDPVAPPTEPVAPPTEPAVPPTEPVAPPAEPAPGESDRGHLEEMVGILDQNGNISSEELSNMNNEELSGIIVDLLENSTAKEDSSGQITMDPGAYDENGAMTEPFDQVYPEAVQEGLVKYDENTLLVKMNNSQGGIITDAMAAVGVAALEAIVPMSETTWYEVKLVAGTDATAALEALRGMPEVLLAEYNYRVETAAIDHYKPFPDDKDFSGNEHHDDQWYMHHCGIPDGMGVMQTNGGSSSVIVAVIDTGVDYDHEDLAQNIWVNANEIPDNGIDDDNNGYVDDYYGVNIITGTGNGDDDNGHGTHVAGIIAAQNNNLGTVGIAYNVKIMPIKAAMASGYLHQSDIAKAILYAYEHGAEVINMSFGGTSCSIAVQDALAVAYNRCVLVASAGNDGAKNEGMLAIPNYPAALTYVLGVMSVDQTGRESAFTNWDVKAFNGVEYELYAPGDGIMSTLPDNRYGILSGTSMAAPVVSAIAAILRSEFTDRDLYPTKFIYGQLCSTSSHTATCLDPELHGLHNLPQIVDLYAALTKLPNPEVNMQDFALFDTEGLDYDEIGVNNGDGVIDAGETIALGLTLRNRWGMSEDTIVTIDTLSMAGIPDPYITIINPEVNYGSVGTYSTQDCGRIYTDEIITGWEYPFYITVAEDCPNDYIFRINVTITCTNALDPNDTTVYTTYGTVELTVRNGYVLPSVIDEDMVLTSHNLYIIPSGTIITAGTTVRVEPGTHIQFWSDDPEDPYADNYIAYLRVDGNFFVEGTKENPVYIYPSELMSNYNVECGVGNSGGVVTLEYADITNFSHAYTTHSSNANEITYAYGCVFRNNGTDMRQRYLQDGKVYDTDLWSCEYRTISQMENCVFYKLTNASNLMTIYGKADGCIFVECAIDFDGLQTAQNCVFLINNNISYANEWQTMSASYEAQLTAFALREGVVWTYYCAETGTAYLVVNQFVDYELVEQYVRELGGDYAILETAEEAAWLLSRLPDTFEEDTNYIQYKAFYDLGIRYDLVRDVYVWTDGTPVDTLTPPQVYGTPLYYRGVLLANEYDHPDHGENCWNHCKLAVFELSGPIYVTDIRLQEYEILLDMESSYRINAVTLPAPVPADQLIFESLDETVVTVDENGLITPVGLGTADVYIYCNDRAVCNYITVTVAEHVPLEGVESVTGDAELAVGAKLTTVWNLLPAETTRRTLTFTSSDETVATVDEYGNVTGISSGTAVITATSTEKDMDGNPIQASITVTVYRATASLSISQENLVLHIEDGTVAMPNVTWTEGGEPALSWRSLDEAVAQIVDGVLVLKQIGTTTLEVKDLRTGLTASCLVWVLDEDLPGVRDMAMHHDGSVIALLEDGRLVVWGSNTNNPAPKCYLTDVVEMRKGDGLTVVRTSGAVEKYYIGYNYFNFVESKVFENGEVVGASGYDSYNWIVWLADGSAYAMGSINGKGQLGVGTTEVVEDWTLINLPGVVSVEDLYDSTYFLTDDGRLYLAGGENSYTTPMLIAENIAELSKMKYDRISVVGKDGRPGDVYGETIEWMDVTMDTVSCCGYVGLGIRDGKVYRLDRQGGTVVKETLVSGIDNAKAVFCGEGFYFIQTEDNKFYGFGNNNNYEMGGASEESYVSQPVMIVLIRPENDVISLVGSNLTNDILAEDVLVLTFNKEIQNFVARLYADGTQVTFGSSTTDMNHVVVSRTGGFEVGVTYYLVIAASAVRGVPGLTNKEEITITFTYAPSVVTEDSPDMPEAPVIHEPVWDDTVERFYWNANNFTEKINTLHSELNWNAKFLNNAILNQISTDTDVTHWLRILGASVSGAPISFGGNYWGTTNEKAIGLQIIDYSDFPNYAQIMYAPFLTEAPENTFPFVVDVTVLNKDGEEVFTVGNEEITVRVTFNRDMDTSVRLTVRFGSYYPYGDYEIPGEYVDARTWEGTYSLNTLIENGYQYFSIFNGCTADGELDLYNDHGRFLFEIDTTAAQALIMQGYAADTGIQLSWTQDDFDTLMGYNIYRSTSEDGYYQRVNTTVIPAETREFFDDTVEPGVLYYYNFTVVKTDLTESVPSGKISIMSKDTMAPNIYHSPVYVATTGSNLIISATVTDNLAISTAYVYYRTVGETSWKVAVMNKLNDKYSAIIPASELTTAGVEYYIEAFDGVSYTYKGSASAPYQVTVQQAVDASARGDVNGDGRISNLDALMLLQAINDLLNLDAEQFARADLNGDGVLSAAEALRILQYVNGTVGDLIMP